MSTQPTRDKDGAVFDIKDISSILPHRYPFLMIDKVLQFEDTKRVVAIKNVTHNEWYFEGHFPNRPVMPGVLILEAMAQAGAILAKCSTGGAGSKLMFIGGAKDVRWRKPVVPGDTLRIEVEGSRVRGPIWQIKGEAYVESTLVAEATLTAAEAD